jgi:hypothetical protein
MKTETNTGGISPALGLNESTLWPIPESAARIKDIHQLLVLSTQFTRKYHYGKEIIHLVHGLPTMTSKIHLSDYNSSISEEHLVMRHDHFGGGNLQM